MSFRHITPALMATTSWDLQLSSCTPYVRAAGLLNDVFLSLLTVWLRKGLDVTRPAEIDTVKITDDQKRIIRETWSLMSGHLAESGTLMYLRIFQVSPGIKAVFHMEDMTPEEIAELPRLKVIRLLLALLLVLLLLVLLLLVVVVLLLLLVVVFWYSCHCFCCCCWCYCCCCCFWRWWWCWCCCCWWCC